MGPGEAELSPHHPWVPSQAWEHRLGFAFGLVWQGRAQGRTRRQLLQGWGSRERLCPSAQRVTGQSQLGSHSFGMSGHARCLKNLMVRGTRPVEAAAGSVLGWEGRGSPGTNKYLWKSALSPWIAEVRAALINANLLTANKYIQWKLLKKSILKK